MDELIKKAKENIVAVIILVLILLILFGVFIFMFFGRGNSASPSGDNPNPFPTNGSAPFGTGDNSQNNNSLGTTTTQANEGVLPALRRLWSEPVPASGFKRLNEDGLVVRFIERATGHLYEVAVEEETPKRILNITIPRIQEAKWFNNGDNLIIRYLSSENSIIETFSARLKSDTEDEENSVSLDGIFLPSDITSLAPSPDGKRIAYVQKSDTGAGVVVSNTEGGSGVELYRSRFKSFRIEWNNPQRIVLTSAPHSETSGVSLAFAVESGNQKLLAESSAGSFTASTNKDLSYTVFSEEKDDVVRLYSRDQAKDTVIDLNVSTLMEKCMWSNISTVTLYCFVPNKLIIPGNIIAWNQGGGNFGDNLWKIDVSTGDADFLMHIDKEYSVYLDAIEPSISDNDSYITFINKADLTTWLLRLIEAPKKPSI